MRFIVDIGTLHDDLHGNQYEQMPHDGAISPGDVASCAFGSSWLVIAAQNPNGDLPDSHFEIGDPKFSLRCENLREIEAIVRRLAEQNGLTYRPLPCRDMDGVQDILFQFRS